MTAPICPYASELEDQVLETGVTAATWPLSSAELTLDRFRAQERRWFKARKREAEIARHRAYRAKKKAGK